MCRFCGRPYEDDHVRPHGPRTASAVAGLCIGCWAYHLRMIDHETEWYECLMEQDGGEA